MGLCFSPAPVTDDNELAVDKVEPEISPQQDTSTSDAISDDEVLYFGYGRYLNCVSMYDS